MSTFLFDKFVFGPVYSRRLGVSLGINLLPKDCKFCNFNCIYCECGWTTSEKADQIELPGRSDLQQALSAKLKELRGTINEPDTITFAGNGEPTIHPEFAGIIDDTIELRNQFAPKTDISVLSNASMLHNPSVVEALKKIEKNILKLDTGIEETFQKINQPRGNISLPKMIDHLKLFDGNLIIQTLFVRGSYNGSIIDNTSEKEIDFWLKTLKMINPASVMIYSIDRGTPAKDLEKIGHKELKRIALKVENEGIKAEIYS